MTVKRVLDPTLRYGKNDQLSLIDCVISCFKFAHGFFDRRLRLFDQLADVALRIALLQIEEDFQFLKRRLLVLLRFKGDRTEMHHAAVDDFVDKPAKFRCGGAFSAHGRGSGLQSPAENGCPKCLF